MAILVMFATGAMGLGLLAGIYNFFLSITKRPTLSVILTTLTILGYIALVLFVIIPLVRHGQAEIQEGLRNLDISA